MEASTYNEISAARLEGKAQSAINYLLE